MAKVNEHPHASTKDFPSQDTTDNWVELDSWQVEHLVRKTLRLEETGGANDVDIRVLGSLDGGSTYPQTIETQTITAGTQATLITVTDYFTDLKVEIKANAAGSQGTVTGQGAGIAA